MFVCFFAEPEPLARCVATSAFHFKLLKSGEDATERCRPGTSILTLHLPGVRSRRGVTPRPFREVKLVPKVLRIWGFLQCPSCPAMPSLAVGNIPRGERARI